MNTITKLTAIASAAILTATAANAADPAVTAFTGHGVRTGEGTFQIHLTATVTNNGPGAMPASQLNFRHQWSRVPMRTLQVRALNPGQSANVTFVTGTYWCDRYEEEFDPQFSVELVSRGDSNLTNNHRAGVSEKSIVRGMCQARYIRGTKAPLKKVPAFRGLTPTSTTKKNSIYTLLNKSKKK